MKLHTFMHTYIIMKIIISNLLLPQALRLLYTLIDTDVHKAQWTKPIKPGAPGRPRGPASPAHPFIPTKIISYITLHNIGIFMFIVYLQLLAIYCTNSRYVLYMYVTLSLLRSKGIPMLKI